MLYQKLIAHFWGSYILREFEFARTHFSFSFRRAKPLVIYDHDSRFNDNGLADKIRGMISSCAFAKATGREFRINHINPFRLEDFFEPNEVDWSLKEGELSYSWCNSWPVIVLDYEKGERLPQYTSKRQYHFYSNVDFLPVINDFYGKEYTFRQLFNELFKPSAYLLNALRPYQKQIDKGYVSVSFRFMQLFGDFKDVRGNTLSEKEQEELAEKCLGFIDSVHLQNPETPTVFVTSDSMKFMSYLNRLDYVVSIPGEISHLGISASKESCLKTFIDYYMISKAKKAYLGYSGEMYKSNFARSAAEGAGIPFFSIEF